MSWFGCALAGADRLYVSAANEKETELAAYPQLTSGVSSTRAGSALPTIALITSVVAAGAPAPAQAQTGQPGCGMRDRMVDHLKTTYGEVRRGGGLQSATGLMELYVSEEGSWTLLLTRPDGTSCPVAVGEAWRNDATPFPQGEKPA